MKLPRGVDGTRLASRLRRFGYEITRQTGSHIRLTSVQQDVEHHITVPAHKELSVGTLHAILREVSIYLEMDLAALVEDLFNR